MTPTVADGAAGVTGVTPDGTDVPRDVTPKGCQDPSKEDDMSVADEIQGQDARVVAEVVADFVRFLETGTPRPGLFAPQIFTDLTLPHWRIQTGTAEEILAVRAEEHHGSSEVSVGRVERTARGFTIELEEWWPHEGQRWYCREMIRADLVGDSIVELAVYCTGDWDEARQREHASTVRLLRP
jgi:hypothetical protein